MRLAKILNPIFVISTGVFAIAVSGCGDKTTPTIMPSKDLGVSDMTAIPDLMQLVDLTAPTGMKYGFIIDSITMPVAAKRYLYNVDGSVDGNGKPNLVNKMFDLNNILALFPGTAPQPAIDSSIAQGNVLQLFQFQSTDPTLQVDNNLGIGGYIGALQAGTTVLDALSGTGSIDVDPTDEPPMHKIAATLVAGKVTSAHVPVGAFPIRFPLSATRLPVPITLYGVAVQVTTMNQGAYYTLVTGQLNGGLKSEDVHSKIVPAVAQMAQDYIDDPNTSQANRDALLNQFKDPANPGKVTPAGVEANVLVQGLIASDVDLFDTSGTLNPNVDMIKDSLSFGVGFTAVAISFPPQN